MQRVRQSRFDAIVTDLEMPEIDGIALTRELSQYLPALPVMIMTGLSGDDCKEIAFRAGAREFLSKPFDVPNLIRKLHRMLLGHNLVKEQVAHKRACSENHEKLSDQQTPIISVPSRKTNREEKGCTSLYRS
jgi:CheY-like chemotaxis protein